MAWLASGRRRFPALGLVHFDPRSAREIEFIYHEIFSHGEYLQAGLSLGPGATVFDVGANVGLFTLYAARRVGSTGRIHAFEPIPTTHGYLAKNVAEHGLERVVKAHPLGLTRRGAPSSAELTHYPHLPGNSTSAPEKKRAELERMLEALARARPLAAMLFGPSLRAQMAVVERVRCPMRALEEVAREEGVERIDLLKIDVEGAELDVLDGAGELLGVRQVVVETHAEAAATVSELLRARGFAEVHAARPRFADELGLDNQNVYARR